MSSSVELTHPISAIIGLGNPGPKHLLERHNIGFRVVERLAQEYHGTWSVKNNAAVCSIQINNRSILLIKPQTFMNSSGAVIPALTKQGIKAENLLVVHDELEKPFAALAIKVGGSHRGHNGLRSIIQACGPDFARLRFGIGRPADKAQVPDYVLQNFAEPSSDVDAAIEKAVQLIMQALNKN